MRAAIGKAPHEVARDPVLALNIEYIVLVRQAKTDLTAIICNYLAIIYSDNSAESGLQII